MEKRLAQMGHARTTSVDLATIEKRASEKLPAPGEFEIDGESVSDAESLKSKSSPTETTWMSLPRKDQLAILFLCRLVDFLQVASLQAYVFFQLKSFDGLLPDSEVSCQAGILQGAFTGAQVLTAFLWGKAADASWCGRKRVLLIGLFGTAISCLGYGFSTNFAWAVFFRAVGGGINGTVGIIRTMIAEITVERKYQSRAFLILPISFSVANTLGPLMGGLLADTSRSLPNIFGEGAVLGFNWIQKYPYALPSVLNTIALTITTLIVFFGLEETSSKRKGKEDIGLRLASQIKAYLFGKPAQQYGFFKLQPLDSPDSISESKDSDDESLPPITHHHKRDGRTLPFRRVLTRNVIFTLITEAFYDFQLGAFTNLWTLFLSTPRSPLEDLTTRSLPWDFTGGLGMPAATVGLATSILGVLGMALQIFLYPPVHARLGTLRGFRWFLLLFPVAYFLAPYLAVLPSSTESPAPASGPVIWLYMTLVQLLQVMARTITLPASIILLNNCSPHPSVLGLVHGLGQSVSAGFRTAGPVIGGWWYGEGLKMGIVGASWWAVALVSALGCVSAMFIYEGSGHEILLEGEEDEQLLG
ncbi:MFS general substrate transporter [Annulohypoxylon maeteangense]|uniref:MFS general substrate transporter n=1 Tax=Annulohypoxylon maeteangense TaxID=1927788 RepID=UPI002008997D|nr:MFS general substrate transporter [Annulohypoxylon maeteangense]KAI0886210.1 MFS general substrate transporter [Annulohypoxylon maeteangense]